MPPISNYGWNPNNYVSHELGALSQFKMLGLGFGGAAAFKAVDRFISKPPISVMPPPPTVSENLMKASGPFGALFGIGALATVAYLFSQMGKKEASVLARVGQKEAEQLTEKNAKEAAELAAKQRKAQDNKMRQGLIISSRKYQKGLKERKAAELARFETTYPTMPTRDKSHGEYVSYISATKNAKERVETAFSKKTNNKERKDAVEQAQKKVKNKPTKYDALTTALETAASNFDATPLKGSRTKVKAARKEAIQKAKTDFMKTLTPSERAEFAKYEKELETAKQTALAAMPRPDVKARQTAVTKAKAAINKPAEYSTLQQKLTEAKTAFEKAAREVVQAEFDGKNPTFSEQAKLLVAKNPSFMQRVKVAATRKKGAPELAARYNQEIDDLLKDYLKDPKVAYEQREALRKAKTEYLGTLDTTKSQALTGYEEQLKIAEKKALEANPRMDKLASRKALNAEVRKAVVGENGIGGVNVPDYVTIQRQHIAEHLEKKNDAKKVAIATATNGYEETHEQLTKDRLALLRTENSKNAQIGIMEQRAADRLKAKTKKGKT